LEGPFCGPVAPRYQGLPLIDLRLELERRAVGGVHLFDAALLVLHRDDLDVDLHRDGAEAFDELAELAELVDGLVGEGLRLRRRKETGRFEFLLTESGELAKREVK
jgi:hypothetical protein